MSTEKKTEITNEAPFPGRTHWTKNYRLLNFFLDCNLQTNTQDKREASESNSEELLKSIQSSLKEGTTSRLTSDFLKLRMGQLLLEEKKFTEFEKLILPLQTPHSFIIQKKNKLVLHFLHSQKRHSQFIRQFETFPVPDTETQIFLVDNWIKNKNLDKGLEIFRRLFKKNKISVFEKAIPLPTIKLLLEKLDTRFWFEKWSHLAKENDFSQFFQEKKYAKSAELIALFYAEYHYAKKNYSKAQDFLKQVKSTMFLSYKSRLLLKMELREREKDFEDIIRGIDELKDAGPLYFDLLLNAGNILFTKEKIDPALKLYQKYIQLNKNAQNPEYWKVQWLIAWTKYRRNQKKEALAYFEKGGNSPLLAYKIPNLYWADQLKRTEPVLMKKYPFTYYYTRTACEENELNVPALKEFVELVNQQPSALLENILESLQFLISHNFIEESLQLIDLVKPENALSTSDLNMLKIIESIIYLKQKKFYQAFISFKNNFSCYQCIYLPAYLSQIYLPIQYESPIEKYSRLYSVDPHLVLSLIREESFFKTDAVSSAHALGLMQVLLKTAKELDGQTGRQLKKNALYDPDTNIRLGIKYLKFLIDKYKGKIHLALAAYNAGDHRVDRWIRKYGDTPDDEFIEMIPFSETRAYVKNVLRNYFYYRFYNRKKSSIL